MRRIAGIVAGAVALAGLTAAPAGAADVVVTGVVTVDGVPLPDAASDPDDRQVQVGYWEPGTGAQVTTTSDPDTGAYALTVPATGGYYLFANTRGDVSTPWSSRTTRTFTAVFEGAGGAAAYAWQALAAAPTPTGPRTETLDLDRTGRIVIAGGDKATVTGLAVVTAGGRDVASWSEASAGPAVADGLVPGRYRVVSRPSWRPDHPPAAWSSPELVVTAGGTTTVAPDLSEVSGGLQGVVRYRGEPVVGARVTVQGVVDGGTDFAEWRTAGARTDGQGRYRVAPGAVLPGRYRVHVSKGRLGDYGGVVVDVAPGAPAVRDVNLTSWGRVRVTVPAELRDRSQDVQLVAGTGRVVAAAGIARGARSVVLSAPAGRYGVVVHRSDTSRYVRREVRLGTGRTTDAGVLRPSTPTVLVGGFITGAVDGGVQLDTDVAERVRSALVRSSGRWLLRDVVPGIRYRVVGLPGRTAIRVAATTRIDTAVRVTGGARGTLTTQGVPLPPGSGAVTVRWTHTARENAVQPGGRFWVPRRSISGQDARVRLGVRALGVSGDAPYELRFPAAARTLVTPPADTVVELSTIALEVVP